MFVEKRKKLELEAKTRENCGCSRPWELCYEAATRLVFIGKTRLNLLTSHLLVKVGFLDSNLLKTFEGPKEVRFGPTLACFKDLEVSYNFLRNRLLQKMHGFFVIPKIPLKGQNCQKLTYSKLIQKPLSCIFSSQTLSKLSRNHKNFRVWSFILKIHQGFKKRDLPFLVWNDHFALSVIFARFCTIFVLYPYITPKSWNAILLTQLTHRR